LSLSLLIEYQEPVHQSGDQFSLRIPMVVGPPRYNPAPVVQTVDLRTGENGWGTATNDPVPDRDRISPPVLDPRDRALVNPTTISIRLQAGFPLGEVKSHFNNVKIESPDSSTRVITLADGAVPADRDFELTWTAAAEKTPSVGLFRERVAGSDYARGDLCHRQFRLDGRHLDRPSEGWPALCALPIAAQRPIQRHPLR
jgi:Ca-activated chloride channel family protein